MAPTLGFEAAGGIAEKLLPGVSFPVLMNTVLPGLLATGALYPFAPPNWQHSLSLDVEKSWPALVVTLFVIVTLGALVSALNGEFYKIYEGRTFWPPRIFDRAKALQQRRVDRLYRKANEQKAVNRQRYDEFWYQLRIYPIHPETSLRYATHPTLLGNILSGYEEYPYNRYGMDAVFYWPRLWLTVEKDQKEQISKSWAVADGLLNLSAVSYLAGLLWIVATAGVELSLWESRWFPIRGASSTSALGVFGWFVLGYMFYRLSLSFHRQNGETFKSLFDLYRDKVKKITALAPHEAELWEAAWAYLQYLRIPCPNCGKGTISIITNDCSNEKCAMHLPEVVKEFRDSGKLVNLPKTDEIENECRDLLSKLLKILTPEENKEP